MYPEGAFYRRQLSKNKRLFDNLAEPIVIHLIEVVPLRDRISDIPLLGAHFITLNCKRYNRGEPCVMLASGCAAGVDRIRRQNTR
jgi:DNA-binding NtrC family response regulator